VGVNTRGLVFTKEARTALAFVSLGADGEREFMFYRHPSADMLFRPEEVAIDLIKAARILHLGSISLISEPSKSATQFALTRARQMGTYVSYDPNLRLALWPDAQSAKMGMLSIWPQADLIKVSEEELSFLTDIEDIDRAVEALWHENLKLLVVTQGAKGCRYFTDQYKGYVPGFHVQAVDTTGAGDGFVAGLLMGLLNYPETWLEENTLRDICRIANAVGALTTTQRGAIPALPSKYQLEDFLKRPDVNLK